MDAIKKRELRAEIQELDMQKHYIQALDLSPGLWEIEVTFIPLDKRVNSYSHLFPVPKIKNSF